MHLNFENQKPKTKKTHEIKSYMVGGDQPASNHHSVKSSAIIYDTIQPFTPQPVSGPANLQKQRTSHIGHHNAASTPPPQFT